ncbi:MAG: hypothetical protein ACRC7N_19005 [Clostridium sp.]
MDKYFRKINEYFTTEKLLITSFIAIFVLNEMVRRFFVVNLFKTEVDALFNINVIFIVCYIFIIVKNYNKINYKYLLLIAILPLIQLITCINTGIGYKYLIFDIIFYFIPMSLLAFKFSEEIMKNVFKVILKILNIYTIVILVIGIIDFITNRQIQSILLDIGYFEESFNHLINFAIENNEPYRYISVYGHPLRNAQLFITFYIINFMGNDKFKNKINYIFYSAVLLIGVTLSNGKTAIVVAFFLVVYTFIYNMKKISIKEIGCVIFGFIIVVNSKFFKNTILLRFKEAIVNKDLTSGRNVIFKLIANNEALPPKLFGFGEGYSVQLIYATGQKIASLEYPFIIFAYDRGIIYTIIFYLILLIPLIDLIRNKCWNGIIIYLVFNLYCNIYSGIALHGDYILQYIMTNILIIYLSLRNKKVTE